MDIMLLPQKISQEEVLKIMDPTLEEMAGLVADKIKELNGGRSVSAVFIVGGGGKNENYAHKVADKLGIARERVALRGEEVMQTVVFEEDIKKDSLLVTPVGICLNYYEQSNNFIFVSFNGSRIKMYDNSNLTVGDVAMQAQFPNDGLFPKRGKALEFTLNGKARMQRGLPGEAAVITINDESAFITSKIRANDVIHVKESTAGPAATLSLEDLDELTESISFIVNDNNISVPKFASVNGTLQSKFYEIKDGDDIEIVNYYTVKQIADFMDVIIEPDMNIYVNNNLADMDTKVYENFTVNWTTHTLKSEREMMEEEEASYGYDDDYEDLPEDDGPGKEKEPEGDSYSSLPEDDGEYQGPTPVSVITVNVNGAPVILRGKQNFVFVDVFDAINFNLADSKGRRIVTNLNGKQAQYMESLKDGDSVDIYWEEP